MISYVMGHRYSSDGGSSDVAVFAVLVVVESVAAVLVWEEGLFGKPPNESPPNENPVYDVVLLVVGAVEEADGPPKPPKSGPVFPPHVVAG